MNKRQRKKRRAKIDRAIVRCMRALAAIAPWDRWDRMFPVRRVAKSDEQA